MNPLPMTSWTLARRAERLNPSKTLRLSFVTVPPERIAEGVAALGQVLRAAPAPLG